jgi:hypothetical protein
MYIEDDILVPSQAIKYWLKYTDFGLTDQKFNLGFLRIEIKDGDEYVTDLEYKLDTSTEIDERHYFVNNKNPYCAFWIYNKAEFNKFVESPYYETRIENVNFAREQSAFGFNRGWYKATVIPSVNATVIPSVNATLLDPDCRIYHMPNNYIYDTSLFAKTRFLDCVDADNYILHRPSSSVATLEKIGVSNLILDKFCMKNHKYLVDQEYYDSWSGTNEYRLYSYLSLHFNHSVILDIGTFTGRSAVAFSHNPTNKVISYDVVDHIRMPHHPIYTKPNIEFRVKNVMSDLTAEFVKNVKIVSIDIDHYGNNEREIMNRLKEIGFHGIIILDDITHHPDPEINRCMNALWDSIEEPHQDFTQYGHCTGTGVVIM